MHYNVRPRHAAGGNTAWVLTFSRESRSPFSELDKSLYWWSDHSSSSSTTAAAAQQQQHQRQQQVQGWLVKNNHLGGLSLARELLLPFPRLAQVDRKSTVRMVNRLFTHLSCPFSEDHPGDLSLVFGMVHSGIRKRWLGWLGFSEKEDRILEPPLCRLTQLRK